MLRKHTLLCPSGSTLACAAIMATTAAVVGEFLEYFAKAYFRLPMDTAYSSPADRPIRVSDTPIRCTRIRIRASLAHCHRWSFTRHIYAVYMHGVCKMCNVVPVENGHTTSAILLRPSAR